MNIWYLVCFVGVIFTLAGSIFIRFNMALSLGPNLLVTGWLLVLICTPGIILSNGENDE